MSKYDIDKIRETIIARWMNHPSQRFCKFDGTCDLVKTVGGVEAEVGIDIPNAPVIFKLWIKPKTSFGLWEADLVCLYDATNMLIYVDADCDDDHILEYALGLFEQFGHNWNSFFGYFHFSQGDLALIEEAVRRYVTGE